MVNYPQLKYGNFTRIVEYNHFPTMRPVVENKGWGSEGEGLTQVLVKEFSTDQGEPYYPVPNKKNQDLYRKYQQMAEEESKASLYCLFHLNVTSYTYIRAYPPLGLSLSSSAVLALSCSKSFQTIFGHRPPSPPKPLRVLKHPPHGSLFRW